MIRALPPWTSPITCTCHSGCDYALAKALEVKPPVPVGRAHVAKGLRFHPAIIAPQPGGFCLRLLTLEARSAGALIVIKCCRHPGQRQTRVINSVAPTDREALRGSANEAVNVVERRFSQAAAVRAEVAARIKADPFTLRATQ